MSRSKYPLVEPVRLGTTLDGAPVAWDPLVDVRERFPALTVVLGGTPTRRAALFERLTGAVVWDRIADSPLTLAALASASVPAPLWRGRDEVRTWTSACVQGTSGHVNPCVLSVGGLDELADDGTC